MYERNGFLRKRLYRSESCEGCPLKKTCTKAQGEREITVSLKYHRYKQQARENSQ
ncbi:transposase [Paenibacillus sp. EZ-K15]|uniref:transposase n=1 Tax=Paenibacillus sp. EZ-K15 TaxID=2044275 RepID=UPI001F438359|nr:transposase [Paenibacillus sp. EZ-K15]